VKPDEPQPEAQTPKPTIDTVAWVAARLKAVRAKAGITQEEVYNRTGIHIGRIESGKANVTVMTLMHICEFYGITLQEFFADNPYLRDNPPPA
jgi:transcriptional regulator with XRE-family HTH domain